jgi:hypothetical protein
MSATRTRTRTKHDIEDNGTRVSDPARQARAAGGERSEPVGRAQRGVPGTDVEIGGVNPVPGP